jgi:hypothetical protein
LHRQVFSPYCIQYQIYKFSRHFISCSVLSCLIDLLYLSIFTLCWAVHTLLHVATLSCVDLSLYCRVLLSGIYVFRCVLSRQLEIYLPRFVLSWRVELGIPRFVMSWRVEFCSVYPAFLSWRVELCISRFVLSWRVELGIPRFVLSWRVEFCCVYLALCCHGLLRFVAYTSLFVVMACWVVYTSLFCRGVLSCVYLALCCHDTLSLHTSLCIVASCQAAANCCRFLNPTWQQVAQINSLKNAASWRRKLVRDVLLKPNAAPCYTRHMFNKNEMAVSVEEMEYSIKTYDER